MFYKRSLWPLMDDLKILLERKSKNWEIKMEYKNDRKAKEKEIQKKREI